MKSLSSNQNHYSQRRGAAWTPLRGSRSCGPAWLELSIRGSPCWRGGSLSFHCSQSGRTFSPFCHTPTMNDYLRIEDGSRQTGDGRGMWICTFVLHRENAPPCWHPPHWGEGRVRGIRRSICNIHFTICILQFALPKPSSLAPRPSTRLLRLLCFLAAIPLSALRSFSSPPNLTGKV